MKTCQLQRALGAEAPLAVTRQYELDKQQIFLLLNQVQYFNSFLIKYPSSLIKHDP